MSDPHDSTSTDDEDFPLSPKLLESCAKVRNSDPSILPEPGEPFKIRHSLSAKEGIELANALLENTNVTYLELNSGDYTKSYAEAMAKYVRSSKRLQHIDWRRIVIINDREWQQRLETEMLCCFLPAIQESTSLKELYMEWPPIGWSGNLAFRKMLANTQSLRSLILSFPTGLQGDLAVNAASSGLKKNTTLRELTLVVSQGATTASPNLISPCDNLVLRKVCLRWYMGDLTGGLRTVLLSETSQITELRSMGHLGESHL
jgi:hypothetical protein